MTLYHFVCHTCASDAEARAEAGVEDHGCITENEHWAAGAVEVHEEFDHDAEYQAVVG